MSSPFFSVIIPVYNGQYVVGRALDSIYSQGLSEDKFEVICVDDCSPTMETFEVLNNYTYSDIRPSNLKILRHDVNKRQGGARNTGVMHATGEWILYLDADDYFVSGSLLKLYQKIKKYSFCDVIAFDNYVIRNYPVPASITKNNKGEYGYHEVDSNVLSGVDFIKRFPISWSPWSKTYRREFLLNRCILFAENVRFEDMDYSFRTTMLADNVVYLSLVVYCYVCVGGSTVAIGNDFKKIDEYFMTSVRIKDITREIIDDEAVNIVMQHYNLMLTTLLKGSLWRLSYGEIVGLLEKYRLSEFCTKKMLKWVFAYPRIYAIAACVLRPILFSTIRIRNQLKKKEVIEYVCCSST